MLYSNAMSISPLEPAQDQESRPAILPAQPSAPPSAPLNPATLSRTVLSDERALSRLLLSLLKHSGLAPVEMAARMGIKPASLQQYLNGRRINPSVKWLVRFAEHCNCKLKVISSE